MERFSYHYHAIEHERDDHAARSASGHVHVFDVNREDVGAHFRVIVRGVPDWSASRRYKR